MSAASSTASEHDSEHDSEYYLERQAYIKLTRFLHACDIGDTEVVKAWLQDPALNPNGVRSLALNRRYNVVAASYRTTRQFLTGLMYACRGCHVDVVRLLLSDSRVDPNVRPPRPRRPTLLPSALAMMFMFYAHNFDWSAHYQNALQIIAMLVFAGSIMSEEDVTCLSDQLQFAGMEKYDMYMSMHETLLAMYEKYKVKYADAKQRKQLLLNRTMRTEVNQNGHAVLANKLPSGRVQNASVGDSITQFLRQPESSLFEFCVGRWHEDLRAKRKAYIDACRYGDVEKVMSCLNDVMLDPTSTYFDKDFQFKSALYVACDYEKEDVVRVLLEDERTNPNLGWDVVAHERAGGTWLTYHNCPLPRDNVAAITPLYRACQCVNVNIMRLLLSHKKIDAKARSYNETTLSNDTPLCVGIDYGQKKVVQELLLYFYTHGKLPRALNSIQESGSDGRSPLKLALDRDRDYGQDDRDRLQIVEMLVFAGARVRSINKTDLYRKLRKRYKRYMKDYYPGHPGTPWEYCARRLEEERKERRARKKDRAEKKRKLEMDGAGDSLGAGSLAKKAKKQLQITLRF